MSVKTRAALARSSRSISKRAAASPKPTIPATFRAGPQAMFLGTAVGFGRHLEAVADVQGADAPFGP